MLMCTFFRNPQYHARPSFRTVRQGLKQPSVRLFVLVFLRWKFVFKSGYLWSPIRKSWISA